MTQRILIAEIATAHGIKGLVKLRYYGEDIADLTSYNPLFTSVTGHDTLMIHVKNAVKGVYLVEIDGINDRNAAEALRGQKLYINEDNIAPPADGEYLQKDLIGCDVFEKDIQIGTVIGMDNFGAGDLLDIKPLSGESFYLPFKDEFVGDIDISKKTIHVNIPDGLRE